MTSDLGPPTGRRSDNVERPTLAEAVALLQRSHPPTTPNKDLWAEWLDDVQAFLERYEAHAAVCDACKGEGWIYQGDDDDQGTPCGSCGLGAAESGRRPEPFSTEAPNEVPPEVDRMVEEAMTAPSTWRTHSVEYDRGEPCAWCGKDEDGGLDCTGASGRPS